MPNIEKHYGKWSYRFIDEHGRRQRRTYDRYGEAKTALIEDLARVEHARSRRESLADPTVPASSPPAIAAMTFDELAKVYLEHVEDDPDKRSKRDFRSLVGILRRFYGTMPIAAITMVEVERFKKEQLAAKLHPQTIVHRLTTLSAMFTFALERGYVRERPIIKRPKCPERTVRYVPEDQIPALLDAARKVGEKIGRRGREPQRMGQYFFLLYSMALNVGLRKGELACLRWPDLDFERGIVSVRSSFNGPPKNRKSRRVPMTLAPDMIDDLRAWQTQAKSEWVFPNRTGGRLISSSRVFNEYFYRVRELAGIDPELNFHKATRHSFATRYMDKDGASLWRLKQYLGHASIETTQIYAHDDEEAAEKDRGILGSTAPARLRVVR